MKLKWFIIAALFSGMFSPSLSAGTVCYFLINDKGETTSYKEPPWDISYPPKPVSPKERARREKMGHLVVSMVEDECVNSEREQVKKKKKEEKPVEPVMPTQPTAEVVLEEEVTVEDTPPPAAESTESVEVAESGENTESVPLTEEAPPAGTETTVDCSEPKQCGKDIKSCAEAKLYMKQCGMTYLDVNGDGVPCELLCDVPGASADAATEPGAAESAEIQESASAAAAKDSSERRILTFEEHTGSVSAVGMYDGKVVSFSEEKKEFKQWDADSPKVQRNFSGLEEAKTLLVDLRRVIIAFDKNTDNIEVRDLVSGRNIRNLTGHNAGVTELALKKSFLASASKDGTVKIWEVNGGKLLQTLKPEKGDIGSAPITHVALDAKQKLAAASKNNMLYIWDIEKGTQIRSQAALSNVSALAACGGRLLVGTMNGGEITSWDMATGSGEKFMEGHLSSVEAIVCAEDKIVSASQDGSIRIWKAGSGELLESIENAHDSMVLSLAVDGKHIISGSKDHKVKIWFNYLLPKSEKTQGKSSGLPVPALPVKVNDISKSFGDSSSRKNAQESDDTDTELKKKGIEAGTGEENTLKEKPSKSKKK